MVNTEGRSYTSPASPPSEDPYSPFRPRPDQLRSVSLEPGFSRHAEGSCLVKFGDTHVLCTASIDEKDAAVDAQSLGSGWVTAE